MGSVLGFPCVDPLDAAVGTLHLPLWALVSDTRAN